jgi:hypothetical protein
LQVLKFIIANPLFIFTIRWHFTVNRH